MASGQGYLCINGCWLYTVCLKNNETVFVLLVKAFASLFLDTLVYVMLTIFIFLIEVLLGL
jgi:hypothetical protein